MKKLAYITGLALLVSCATSKQASVKEDTMMLTRKYVGNFVEYRQHVPEKFGEPYLIWI
jgi:hypothetical protein